MIASVSTWNSLCSRRCGWVVYRLTDHARTHARTHARAHTHTQAHTHTISHTHFRTHTHTHTLQALLEPRSCPVTWGFHAWDGAGVGGAGGCGDWRPMSERMRELEEGFLGPSALTGSTCCIALVCPLPVLDMHVRMYVHVCTYVSTYIYTYIYR